MDIAVSAVQADLVKAERAVAVRRMAARDLDEVDRIFRDAFGTFLGVPDLFGDRDYVRTRWRANPETTLAAELDGRLVGSNFVTRWGSVAFFGPLSVRPDLWDQGTAKCLMERTGELLSAPAITHAGLFTFPHSPKHLGLYQRFGYWPRFLTAIMWKPAIHPARRPTWHRLGDLARDQQEAACRDCTRLTEELWPGLDLQREIRAVEDQGLGLTVLLEGASELEGLAVCHVGAGSEAGSGALYVKVVAAHPGPGSADAFEALVDACEDAAVAAGVERVELGVSTACADAYRRLLERGFRTSMIGVTMHRPNEAGYHRPGLYVVDDWR